MARDVRLFCHGFGPLVFAEFSLHLERKQRENGLLEGRKWRFSAPTGGVFRRKVPLLRTESAAVDEQLWHI